MEVNSESGDTVTVTVSDQCLPDVMPKPQTPETSPTAATPPTPPLLPEMRLVLLGRKGAGKSAAGNALLGGTGAAAFFESGRPTEECVKRRADAAGRRVTVVDTPGWEWYYPLNSTPDWVRRETWRSVSLCSPGPHAVLLVVRSCASVTEAFARQIEEHLEPLGRGVWDHALLLFTRGGDELGLVSIEQRILNSGPALQGLLERCGGRYHILDNSRGRGDAAQVRGLIRKVEEMVRERTGRGGGGYFGVDNLVLQELEADGKRRARERRKKQRQLEAQTQRGAIRAALMSDGSPVSELDTRQSFSKPFRRLPEVRLVLLGERETGKSSAGNAILGGAQDFFPVGAVTEECARRQAEVAMRLVTVVDSPGWEGGVAGPTPERVKREIAASVAACPPGPHALLLALRLDTVVKAGPVMEHLELLGEGVWRHVVLLFTHGDQLREGVGIEQYIQTGGKDLQWLLEKCRGRYHVISSNAEAGGGSSVTELLEMVEKMAVGNRCEAFSGLVQEVSSLSQQRNDRLNQRLKELSDKMLRQESELRKIREREVKSIRWFFDRKKKNAKSPGKTGGGGAATEKEEEEDEDEEDRRSLGKTKNEMGELEERMRWLTEDKEREIQDLNAEHVRILATLHQCTREKDDGILKLELKEREIEELTERIDEQQVKVLDLERLCSEKDCERKQRESDNRARHQALMDEIKNLSEGVELVGEEKAELKKRVEELQADLRESESHHQDVISQHESVERDNRQKIMEVESRLMGEMERTLNEKEEEMEFIKLEMKAMCQEKQAEMERRLSEKGNEMEGMKAEMNTVCEKMQAEMEHKLSEKDNDMKDMKIEMEKKFQEMQTDLARKLTEKDKDMESMKLEMKAMCVEKQTEMERRLTEKDNETEGVKLEMKTLCDKKQAEMESRLNEKDNEMKDMNLQMEKKIQEVQAESERKLAEKDKEMEGLTLEMKTECHEMQAEMRRRQGEKDRVVEDVKCESKRALEKKVEELTTQHRKELGTKIEENERKMENVRQCHQDEITCIQQKAEREIKEIKQKHVDELEKISQETSQLKQQHGIQMGEMRQEHEKEKKTILLSYTTEITQKNEEKERAIIELKQQHTLQTEETRQENEKEKEEIILNHEKEMANIIQEKEQEIVELKRQHVSAMERERQEKDAKEQVVQVQNGKIEEILHSKERETIELKQHIENIEKNLQLKEQRERLDANHRRELEQRLQEKEHEMKEMKLCMINEKEKTVKEQEMEMEKTRQQTDARETKWREEQSKRDERKEEEIGQMKQIIERNAQELTKTQEIVTQKDKELEEVAERFESLLKQLKESHETNTSTITEMQRHHAECARKRDAEMTQKLQEKEAELDALNQRDGENEKEISHLRQTIEQTKSELKELTGKMEKETTNMIGEYEREIARIKQDIESTTQEKENAKSRLREVEEDGKRCLSDVTKKYEESQAQVIELQEQNQKMTKEIEDLHGKYEEHERECKAQRSGYARREEEITERLCRYEEQVRSKDSEIQSVLRESERQVATLKRANETLQREVERMNGTKPQGELHDAENNVRETIEKANRDAVHRDSERCNGDYEVDMSTITTHKVHRSRRNREPTTAVKSSGSARDAHVMYQEVGVVEEPDGRKEEGAAETESDRRIQGPKETEDQRVETSSSAPGSNKCQSDTLRDMGEREMKGCVSEEMENKRKGNKPEEAKVRSSSHHRNTVNKNLPESELRVVMLRENRYSHRPTGITILGREASQADGSCSEPWRGQIASRNVSVVEPLGLGWRNGPDPHDTAPRKNILDSISLSHPGPHVLLLVIPAYLTLTPKYRKAVEEHMGLFGEEMWRRTLLLFTWGETLGESAEQHILRNGDLMALVEKCGGRYHVLTSKLNSPLIEGLFEKIEDMVATNNTA